MRFSKTYFLIFLAILVLEVIIALFVRDAFVRPYLGDTLAVILVYCFFKTIISDKITILAVVSLLIAFCIETLQATPFIAFMGLCENSFATVILGTSFSWIDMLAYTAGAFLILIFEYRKQSK
jgi:hypothetical protein